MLVAGPLIWPIRIGCFDPRGYFSVFFGNTNIGPDSLNVESAKISFCHYPHRVLSLQGTVELSLEVSAGGHSRRTCWETVA